MSTQSTTPGNAALDRAMAQWARGCTIPVSLVQELIEEGYDPQSLEQKFRKRQP